MRKKSVHTETENALHQQQLISVLVVQHWKLVSEEQRSLQEQQWKHVLLEQQHLRRLEQQWKHALVEQLVLAEQYWKLVLAEPRWIHALVEPRWIHALVEQHRKHGCWKLALKEQQLRLAPEPKQQWICTLLKKQSKFSLVLTL